MKPVHLAANQPPGRFYKGGPRIAEFRGRAPTGRDPDPHIPEDWVGSTTTVRGSETLGLTLLDGQTTLREAVAANPHGWLGGAHIGRHGTDTVLVKLLDAGERLPVHFHPNRTFAHEHLGLGHGKTEAWIALRDADAHVAFTRDVSEDELRSWVDTQDVAALLAAMHHVPLRTGDALFVPAGLPHAIGEGNFIVEIQEPTDLSVLLEWDGYPIDGCREGHLDLGVDLALQAVDRRGRTRDEVLALNSVADADGNLFPQADEFFRAHRLSAGAQWDAGFGVLVVLDGSGVLQSKKGETDLIRGDTVLIPFAAGPSALRSGVDLDVILCRPPL